MRSHPILTVVSLLSRFAGEAALAKLRSLPAFRFAVILLGWLALGQALALRTSRAQDEEKPAPSIAPRSGNQPTTAADEPLRILWLRNPATGELVPVPGLTIDEYDKLDRIRRGLPPETTAPPSYVLSDLKLTGKAKGASVACELTLDLELRDDRWARIPLGLSRAVIRSAPNEENWLVAPDNASDGFILWAKGASGDKKTLKLPFDYPLDISAEVTRLQLPLPRARTATADFTIEANDATLRIEGSGTIDSSKFAAGVGEIHCSGFASNFDLTWKPKSQPTTSAPWLEAAGPIEIRVDGRRQIRADARLRIRTFGAMAQPLRIQLPKGMRLSPDAAQVSPLVRSQSIANSSADTTASHQVLELNLDPAAPSDFELRVQAESDGPIAPDVTKLSLEGFEVIGAKRQWGYVDLFLTPDWYVAAGQAPAIRRVDVESGATTDSAFARSRFEYAAQGASILVSARLPRTLVEPSYDVTIESGQMRLEGVFKYRFRGPSAGGVAIDLADWNLERVSSPDAAFLVDDIQQNGSKLITPLSPQPLPAGAESTLRVEARRNGGEAIAQLRLPQPTASVETPAIVRVLSDVNLEITPRSTEFKGVSVDSAASSPNSPQQRGQFVYRTRPGVEQPLLAFDVQVRKQSLVQTVTTQLTLTGRRSINVQHEVQLNIAYEPMREITLDIPLAIASLESVQVMLDDQPLQRNDAVQNEVADENGQTWTRCRYGLPQAYLGPLKFSIQFPFVVPASLDEAAQYHLPLPKLLTMSQLQSKAQQLIVRDSTESIQVNSREWSPELLDESFRTTDGSRRYSSVAPRTQIVFQLAQAQTQTAQVNRCERWWLQTTLSDTTRNDRLCIRMNNWSSPLRIRLPEGCDPGSLVAAVDGAKEELPQSLNKDRIVTLNAGRSAANKSHVIELWYQCDSKSLGWGAAILDAPALVGDEMHDRIYWQLLTPADWYSLRRPAGWTFEYATGIRDGWWGVGPSLEQDELEKWVGATSQSLPPKELNQYLFSALSPHPSISLLLAPRRDLWLFGLGSLFFFGALLIHISSLRRPIVFLALATLAAAVIVFEPHWCIAVAQFLIVGLGITLVVWMLRATLAPKQITPIRSATSRSGARSLDTSALPPDSASVPRRGSSISGAPAPAGPAP